MTPSLMGGYEYAECSDLTVWLEFSGGSGR